MRHSHQDALERWLAAERDDRAEESEAALLELLEALPAIAPPAGFADRVLVRAGLAAPARQDLFAWRPLRIVLALCLVAAGLGALWLPPVLLWLPRVLAGFWSLSGLVRGSLRTLIDASGWLASALRMWDLLLTIDHALAQPLAVPQVMAILLGCLLASSLALRFLRDQITGERNWKYVDPI
ncbi:MAG TPA: hypothetical protein VGH73_02775 [Thermoanaerobaculia bacterium]|jgi:hypothetical protein